jgi:hypothetical protein
MSDADNYRANLAVCWQSAEKTSDELERRAWLEMAESWRLLVITDSGSSTVEDFAVGSRELERGRGPWLRDRHRGSASARLGRLPVWIFWVVSRAVQMTDLARGTGMLRWPTLTNWVQERGTHNFLDMYQRLIQLARQYFPEDRLRERAASFLDLILPRTDDQRASPWRAAPRRKFTSLSANKQADSARQRPARGRA